jgi:uncharacterized protein (DUF433 family)
MSKQLELQPTVVRTSRGLTIAGTRITLYDVMDYVRAGHSPESIQGWLKLTTEQTAAAMSYIEQHRPEVEAEYQQVLEEAEANRRYWEERNRERFEALASTPPTPEQAAIRARIAAQRKKLGLS